MTAISKNLSPVLHFYVNSVMNLPKFSFEEEQNLFKQWRKTRNKSIRDAILMANLRYVVAIAFSYRYYSFSLEDLISEGNVGLLVAFGKYDRNLKTKFITYAAYWIRAYILNYIIKSFQMGRTGCGPFRSKYFFKLKREMAKSLCRFDNKENVYREIADRCNIKISNVYEFIEALEMPEISLDHPLTDRSGITLKDFLTDDALNPEELLMRKENEDLIKTVVSGALNVLDNRERFVIEKRIFEEEKTTLAEIGRQLGISRERARQIEAKALNKIKSLFDADETKKQAILS